MLINATEVCLIPAANRTLEFYGKLVQAQRMEMILVPAWMTGRVAPFAAASKTSDGWIVHPLKSWKREADGEFESVLTQIPPENCSIAGWIDS